jgi:hypothetical protein
MYKGKNNLFKTSTLGGDMGKKLFIIVLAMALGSGIIGLSARSAYAADSTPATITNLDFAKQLAQKLNIALPTGVTGAEYFTALANALSAKGINNFVGLTPNGVVSYGEMVEVMYNVAGGKGATTIDQKLSFLNNNGYSMFAAGDFNAPASDSLVNNLFSSNTFNELVAEAYSSAAGAGLGDNLAGTDAPGSATESPASAI